MGFLDISQLDLPAVSDIGESLSRCKVDRKPIDHVNDLFRERASWNEGKVEPRCNLDILQRCYPKVGGYVYCSFVRTATGRTFTEIKSDESLVDYFSSVSAENIQKAFGSNLSHGGFCLVVPPRRRHRDGFHFATAIARDLHDRIGIPFYEVVATCRTAQRIGVDFDLAYLPDEPNLIVYDDIVTTGSTLYNMRKLFSAHGKTLFFVCGIFNKHIQTDG